MTGSRYRRFTDLEYQRRWAGLDAVLADHEVDAVAVYGTKTARGAFQYLTAFGSSREAYVCHSRGADPALYVQLFNHVPTAVEMAFGATVAWAGSDTAETVAADLQRRLGGRKRVGIIGPLPYRHVDRLRSVLNDVEIIDLLASFTAFRLVKSAEEIEWATRGIARCYFFDGADPPVRAADESAVSVFENLGADVIEVDLPSLAQLPLALAATQHESQLVLLPLALDHPDGFASPAVRYRILAGEFVRAADQRRGMQIRNKIRREVLDLFDRVDLVLSACNSTVAFPIEAARVPVGSGEESVDLASLSGQSRLTTRLTLPWNLSGVPAISLPSGQRSDGMPIGLQLAAGPLQESTLLSAAFAYEATAGGYEVPPLVRTAISEGDGE